MNRIEDERIRFYFQHEAKIREWARLEGKARKFVHRFYRSLEDDLDAALKSGKIAEKDVESFFSDSEWPKLGLRRPSWPSSQGGDGPRVTMEWQRKKALFPPRGSLALGVRWNAMAATWAFPREAHPDYPKKSQYWPAYRYSVEPPKDNFWEGDNLKDYREALVEKILKAWKDLAPLVDKALDQPRQ